MVTKTGNNEKSQNYVELTESQIFDKIKEEGINLQRLKSILQPDFLRM